MKKVILNFVLILSLIFAFNQTNASHIAGGDFEVECLGNDSFLVTLNLYRDCDGIQAPSDVTFEFLTYGSMFTKTTPYDSVKEVSQICETAQTQGQTTCNNGALPGVEHYYYSVVVHLPNSNQWALEYQD